MSIDTWSNKAIANIPWESFSEENSGFTQSAKVIRYFTQGQCHALAWELYKLTKWRLAILSDDLVGKPDYAGHAFIVNDKDLAVDIRGVQEISEFRKDWTFLPYLHIFRSPVEYKKEMSLWEGERAFNRDPLAKYWARTIVDVMNTQ